MQVDGAATGSHAQHVNVFVELRQVKEPTGMFSCEGERIYNIRPRDATMYIQLLVFVIALAW